MSRAYKKRIALSKANLDSEVRAIAEKMKHRPAEEVAAIIRERTHSQVDMDYLRSLLTTG